MALRYKFPIRYKILGVLSAVVVAAVALYLYLAVHLFREDKTQLIYELNESNVKTLSSDVEIAVKRTLDKLKLIVGITNAVAANTSSVDFSAVLGDDEELVRVVSVELDENYNPLPGKEQVVRVYPKNLEAYKKDESYLAKLRAQIPVNFKSAIENGIWIRNSTLHGENGEQPVPLYTVAVKVDTGDPQLKRVLYAESKLDEVLAPFTHAGIAKTYVVDSEGFVLAHSDLGEVVFDRDYTHDPLITSALSSKVRSAVQPFDLDGKAYLGSYFHVGLGHLVVASKVERDQAMAAARRLVEKSLIYAAIVITAAFLIAIFFSHTLTSPIHVMLEATQAIAKGDFTQQVKVSTHDELAVLAESFNTMTGDLRLSREQLEEYSRNLEHKVRERTSELEASTIAIKETQEALVRTTRLASVGEIAGRAAHEVLNPLTNVIARLDKAKSKTVGKSSGEAQDLKLQSEILQAWVKAFSEKGKDGFWESLAIPSQAIAGKTLFEEDLENLRSIAQDSEKRIHEKEQDLDFLLKEAHRIAKIVNEMRQLTRVSGSKKQIVLHDLIEETISTMKDVITKRGIATEAKLSTENLMIKADHDELLQVFSNLLRNSMQAIEEALQAGRPVGSPPKIWFSTQVVDAQPVRKIQIRICDNGPGIIPEDVSKVFETSFTTKSVEEGTGLGLSIARRFIRAYDGEIIVERSEPGVETIFLIEIPESV